MVTLETLRVINADLDAERREQFFIRAGNTKLRLKDIQEQDEGSDGGIEEVAEEQEDIQENLPDPEDTEHMEILKRIIGYFNFMGAFFGVEIVFNWNWINFWWFFGGSNLLIAWIFMFTTAYFHYANGEIVRVLEPLVLFGLLISCSQKWIGIVIHMESIMALFLNFRTLCRRIDKRSSRVAVLKTSFLKLLTFMKVYTFGVFFTASFLLIFPIKAYITERVVISIIPIEFYFLDSNTTVGMLTTDLLQGTMGFWACIGSILYGLSFIVLVTFYGIKGELLVEDFKELDKMWTGKTKHSVAYRHAFLRNICFKRQDMNRYMDTIKMTYETKLFYYFCVNYFSQILALYQIMINDWHGGFGLALGLFTEMMFFCFMGTKVSISDDRLCYIIYDTNWYEYDLMSQKVVLLLLMEAQVTRDLQLRFIGPLNLVTFITIVKSIYSYYTVLSEML